MRRKPDDGCGTARRFRSGRPGEVREVRERVRSILAFRGYGIPVQDREDLEQEILTQLWQAMRDGDSATHEGFWGLVKVITVRRSIDWLRTRKLTAPVDESLRDSEPDPIERTLHHERVRLVAAALSRLRQPCRELIHWHVALGETYGEISRRVGKSPGALRIQMYRCIRNLQRTLAELEIDGGTTAGLEGQP